MIETIDMIKVIEINTKENEDLGHVHVLEIDTGMTNILIKKEEDLIQDNIFNINY